MCVPKVVR